MHSSLILWFVLDGRVYVGFVRYIYLLHVNSIQPKIVFSPFEVNERPEQFSGPVPVVEDTRRPKLITVANPVFAAPPVAVDSKLPRPPLLLEVE